MLAEMHSTRCRTGAEDTLRNDMVVVFSMLSACGYAVASVLQQRAAASEPRLVPVSCAPAM